jgi:hypothetical protein
MQFLNRLMGADPIVPRSRREDRAPRRRAAQFSLETLEDRDLKSDIPGVSTQWGVLMIHATQDSNNVASVSTESNGMLQVSLNGQSEEVNPADIWGISYIGGQGGSDTFANNTNFNDTVIASGGNNHITGGGAYNLVYLSGDSNSYDARGGHAYVFAVNGPNDNITPYSTVTVFSSSFSGW